MKQPKLVLFFLYPKYAASCRVPNTFGQGCISTHLLKLIQSTVELHTSGAIYRKGDDFFHCLVCNAVFPLKSFITHFEQADHIKFYKKCCESFKDITSNVNICSIVASNLNECNIKNTESIKEISDINENQQQTFLMQRTMDDTTLYKAKEDSVPEKYFENDKNKLGPQYTNNNYDSEKVTEVTNIYNADHFEVIIPSENFKVLQEIKNLQEVIKDYIPVTEYESDILRDKNILKQQATKHENVSEREINKVSKTHSEVQTQEFQIQQKIEILQEVVQESIPTNEKENITSNSLKQQAKNNYQVSEVETNKVCKNDSSVGIKTTGSIQTLQTSNILQVILKSINNAEISGPQSKKNEHGSEKEINTVNKIHSEAILALESYQNQQTMETPKAIQGWLLDKENKIETVNKKEIPEQQLTNKKQIFEYAENKCNENHFNATVQQHFKTQTTEDSTIKEVEQMSLSKKEQVKIIANVNKIRYKEGYTKAYCSICVSNIPSSLKNIKRHVTNLTHTRKVEHISQYISNVIPLYKFVQQIVFIELKPLAMDVVINNTFCVDLCSYLLMTKHHSYIRCHVCELNFNVGLFDDHRTSEIHDRNLENIPVLCSFPSEFVREVQPGFYHCGFCNKFEGSYQGLREHFKLGSHLKQKSIAGKRLQYVLLKNK